MEELYSEQPHSDFLINIFLYLLYHLSIHLSIQSSIHFIFLIQFNLSTYSPFLSLSISSCISGIIFFLPEKLTLKLLLMQVGQQQVFCTHLVYRKVKQIQFPYPPCRQFLELASCISVLHCCNY